MFILKYVHLLSSGLRFNNFCIRLMIQRCGRGVGRGKEYQDFFDATMEEDGIQFKRVDRLVWILSQNVVLGEASGAQVL